MAEIIPFRGLRYNRQKAENMAALVTPPYDVIDTRAQDKYYDADPHNIIRLEYGKIYPSDGASDNRYTRAASDFLQWRQEKILVPESAPALYLHEHEFYFDGEKRIRTGLICAVKLEPYESGVILPHEETIPKHKADRLALMQSCRANFSPIFGLYADREEKIEKLLRSSTGSGGKENSEGTGAPELEFTDENGHRHRMWVITDPAVIRAVQDFMSGHRIIIADGHHRYETALAYRNERRQTENNPRPQPYDYVMMTLVNLFDPGLVVLPTHRLIRNVESFRREEFLSSLAEDFEIEELDSGAVRANPSEIRKKLSREARAGERHAFAFYHGHRLYLLLLKDEDRLTNLLPQERSPAWRSLDVSLLHCLIIERHLGIGEEQRRRGEHLAYTRDEGEAIAAVDAGKYQMAFFMNPPRVEQVMQVASNGEKMPQKSTFFYPKLITGLVIYSFD